MRDDINNNWFLYLIIYNILRVIPIAKWSYLYSAQKLRILRIQQRGKSYYLPQNIFSTFF